MNEKYDLVHGSDHERYTHSKDSSQNTDSFTSRVSISDTFT